jgi:metallo-beta-lactamase family protein
MRMSFLGATGTVTGSKYLVETAGGRVMIDCGLFQGFKQLRLRNWAHLPIEPGAVDAVVLTHAHLDHSGYLPRLWAQGFRGKVYCTEGTRELCRILLPDSARLQEEDAKFANQRGFSKHSPALPLYTERDAEAALALLHAVPFGKVVEPVRGLRVSFSPASHLLGAASVSCEAEGSRLLLSGDLGRDNDVIMPPPAPPPPCDYLVIESTYGDRLHPAAAAEDEMCEALAGPLADGGVVVVPTFAIGRAQELLVFLDRLQRGGRLPDVPVYLDSPMAIEATAVYARLRSQHRLSAEECARLQNRARYITTAQQSRELDASGGPMILLAASGMATGGRVIHHLKRFAPEARNLILLSGFQAGGTRGAALAAGAEHIRIHGEEVPVRAQVRQLRTLSAHADADGLLGWARQLQRPPRRVFVTHGEPGASDALRARFEHELHWPATVPDYREAVSFNGEGGGR